MLELKLYLRQLTDMLFRKRQEYKPEIIPIVTEPQAPPKIEINDTNYVTSDAELVFKLQDRFIINDIHLDKQSGIKTFSFNAKTSEVEQYLREEK